MTKHETAAIAPQLPDSKWIRRFRQQLFRWFDRHARELPWRANREPYRIWLSEIMLQQTQVATVIPYFEAFISEFPTIESLASAEEGAVMRRWEGLGYYRRARQLHRAAQDIVERHGGAFPSDPAAVRALPGVGRYTAGAILSIAFDQREPIVEANTARLFSRLLAYEADLSTSAAQEILWQFAERLLPRKRIGDFNQALMELGSEVCTPRDPKCDDCPVRLTCPTRTGGLQSKIPAPKRRIRFESVREAAVVVRRDVRVLLRRCGDHERWSGLWDFPRFRVESRGTTSLQRELAGRIHELTGAQVTVGDTLATMKHGVTRFRITLTCYEGRYEAGRLTDPNHRWVPATDLAKYPLSVTGRKISNHIV